MEGYKVYNSQERKKKEYYDFYHFNMTTNVEYKCNIKALLNSMSGRETFAHKWYLPSYVITWEKNKGSFSGFFY